MAYADYTFYTTTFLGTAIASSGDFAALALRASAVLDQLTYNRAVAIITAATDTVTIDKIKKATCALAEELHIQDTANGVDGISSESIGNYSVSYSDNSNRKQTNSNKNLNAITLWLTGTDLLYKGFASGEYSGLLDEDY